MEKKCITCGNNFEGRKKNKYCSKECYHESLRGSKRPDKMHERIERECLGCNVKFETTENKNRKYCTFKCYRSKFRNPKIGLEKRCKHCNGVYINEREEQVCCSMKCNIALLVQCEREPAKEVMSFCGWCLELFIHSASFDKKYCKSECYHKSLVGRECLHLMTGSYVNCSHCGSEFYAIKHRVDNRGHLYCNMQCRNEHVSFVLGGVSNKTYRSNFTRKVWYKDILFKSTWEALFAIHLDEQGVTWEYEKHRIRYELDGKQRGYNPDFYVLETDMYYEIKGLFTDEAKRKMKAVAEQHPNLNIKILQQKELMQKKIVPRNYAKNGVIDFINKHPKLEVAH